MATQKTILLTAGSGNIGRVLAPLLLKQDPCPKIVLPTSSIDKFRASNPAAKDPNPNVILAEGSIRDPIWFESLLKDHNVEAVFLCVTGVDEMFTNMNCLDAIAKAGTVKRVVYLSILADFVSEDGMKTMFQDRGYPHIYSKLVVENRLKYGNFPFQWTVLGPPIFFSNDLRQKMPLTQMGMYMEPNVEKGGSKISLDDIALAACKLLVDNDGYDGKKVNLGSKKAYSTAESAALWSRALGKPIKTQTADKDVLDEFEQNLRNVMGPGLDGMAWARDLRLLYEYLVVHGVHISEEDYKTQVQLLGKEPQDYGEWIKATVATWNS